MSFHQLLSGRPPMTRRQKDPLRPLTSEERRWLARVARSHAEPASHVARAKALLAVADGMSYTQAAKAAGRRSGDAVSNLLWRFNRGGLRALEPGHGGGPTPTYTSEERERILAEARRAPDREKDGTAEWSLTTLRRSLRGAPEGLPSVSTHTIWKVCCTKRASLGKKIAAGARAARSSASARTGRWWRSWTPTRSPKKLVERAYLEGERELGVAVWGEDEAGPYQTAPYPGASWEPRGRPSRRPHEYVRRGTAKLLTLFHPATGEVRIRGVRSATNEVLHPWLKEQLAEILASQPPQRRSLGERKRIGPSGRAGKKGFR